MTGEIASDPQGWLETDKVRRVSDIALGVLLLIAGVCVLLHGTQPLYRIGTLARMGPQLFPAVLAVLLCIVAVVLFVRAARHRSPAVRRSRPLYVAIVAVGIVALFFAGRTWGMAVFVYLGPGDFTAIVALELAIAIALAHTSRIRAFGMALLGLLLATVGTDVNSGVVRYTMGLDALSDGIGALIVLAGVFVAGDALVCLASPPLFLRTYTRLFTTWRVPQLPLAAMLVMRLAGALALAAACYFAYVLSNSYFDVGLVLTFGVFGVAAKILGWNRFLLYFGFTFGAFLEENIRRSLLLSRGDPFSLFTRPIGGPLLVVAIAILVAALVFSTRRSRANG
jgi:TctA family transporter